MPASTLLPGEKVFEEADYHDFLAKIDRSGDHPAVEINGERVLLSRQPPPPGYSAAAYAEPFASAAAAGLQLIGKSDLDAAIDDQLERKARCSDYVDFDPFYQNGLPTCWAIGTAQMFSIFRRIMGLPHVQLSGCSLAVPISGGHRGGYEGDSVKYAVEHGVASVATWPENNTDRSLNGRPEVAADRLLHKAVKIIELNGDQEWWSLLLRTRPGVFAYDWMSHVMAMCDFVRIEAGRYGYRPRNSWGKWGSNNALGFSGFNVYPMGHGTPDSGFGILDITPSEK